MEAGNYLYSDITQKIIGCAMKVHSHFGMGFPEVIYKRSLLLEIEKTGFSYKSEVEKDIYYDGCFIGKRRLDIIVENKVLVELKAINDLDNSCHNQIINYLRVFNIEVGLLLNFGKSSLEFKRFASYEKNLRNQ